MSKYRNKKVNVDGIWFDSIRESRRYGELKLLEKGGYISDLRLQVPYELIPNQKVDGRVVERKVRYIADFTYHDNVKNEDVVEDAKGYFTEVYRLKKKLMMMVYGIQIKEV